VERSEREFAGATEGQRPERPRYRAVRDRFVAARPVEVEDAAERVPGRDCEVAGFVVAVDRELAVVADEETALALLEQLPDVAAPSLDEQRDDVDRRPLAVDDVDVPDDAAAAGFGVGDGGVVEALEGGFVASRATVGAVGVAVGRRLVLEYARRHEVRVYAVGEQNAVQRDARGARSR